MQPLSLTVSREIQKPILSPSGRWCRFGIRDPSILCSPNGIPVLENGMITIYFNGRNRPISDGGKTRIGRARLTPDLERVHVDDNYVFEHETYAAQGSIICLSGSAYWMFYSHGTDLGFMRATSTDGRKWKSRDKVILEPEQFGCSRIGLPYVTRYGSEWLMVFEGICGPSFHIYAAVSGDGEAWHPACDGRPIYNPRAMSWDGGGQANPSVVFLENDLPNRSKWMMLYNGHSSAERSGWNIGVLITDDPLGGIWQGGNFPLLQRKAKEWHAGRLEGARLLPSRDHHRNRLLFFGLPGLDSYKDGAIGAAEINIDTMNNYTEEQQNEAEITANNELARRYFNIWDTFPIQKFTRRVENKWIDQLVQPGDSILLAGSGGGREIEALVGGDNRIVALDISPEMLRIGRERFPFDYIEWRLGDIHSPPTDIGKFDHVFALGGVFAYLKDPKQAACALAGTLKAHGSLTICVMNAAHPTEQPGRKEIEKGRVRQAFFAQEICELIEGANLSIERVRGFRFFVDNLPAEWNKTAHSDTEIDSIMRKAIELERMLLNRMDADNGKFIWVTGRK